MTNLFSSMNASRTSSSTSMSSMSSRPIRLFVTMGLLSLSILSLPCSSFQLRLPVPITATATVTTTVTSSINSNGIGIGIGIGSTTTTRRMSYDYDQEQQQQPTPQQQQNEYESSTNHQNQNQNIKEYFATCIPGLSHILAQELIDIGADNVEISGTSGVSFTSPPPPLSSSSSNNDDGDDMNIKDEFDLGPMKEEEDANNNSQPQEQQQPEIDIGMKAYMYVRTAHRIMEKLSSSTTNEYNGYEEYNEYDGFSSQRITNRDTLYNYIQTSTYPILQNLLGNGKGGLLTLNINCIMNNPNRIPKDLCHSHYTSLTVKNALVDQVRSLRKDGIRPDVELTDPDVPLMVVLRGVLDEDMRNGNKRSKNRRGRNNHSNNNRRGGGGRGNGGNYRGASGSGGNDYNNDNDYDRDLDSDNDKSVHVSVYRILHSGGSSLHRRGYRSSSSAIHKAAMKESLAAGLLLQSGWHKLCEAARYGDGLPAVLVDPMCGSGTFCVEAAMIASDYAPGLMRMRCFDKNGRHGGDGDGYESGSGGGGGGKWNPHYIPPVVRWKDANKDYWKQLVVEARERASSGMEWMKESNSKVDNDITMTNCVIMANELNPSAYELANDNILNSGFEEMISLHQGDCIDWEIQDNVIPGRTIVTSNPPWGLRLTEDVEESWLSLKSFLRDQCNESEAWVLSGSKDATRYLRMKKTRSVVIKTADQDLRWIQYHVFKKKAPVLDDEIDG